jgi:hypothetical protein
MSTEPELREKLRKIEAVFARPGTHGERQAAKEARDRVRAKLAELESERALRDFRISIPDLYSRALFNWLCRKHRVKTYHYRRQPQTTIAFRTSDLIYRVMSREFDELNAELLGHLKNVANKFIVEKVSVNPGQGA